MRQRCLADGSAIGLYISPATGYSKGPHSKEATIMKTWKVLTFAAMAVALLMAPASAQNPILNPGFESWSAGNPVNWMTSNNGTPGTISQSADAHSGSRAVRGDPVELFPGFNAQPMILTGDQGGGFATTTRWTSFDGFYKFNVVGGDQILISVILIKNQNPVGGGSFLISAPASTYQPFSTPIFYNGPDVPDSGQVVAFLVGPGVQSSPHLGSYFLFDDFAMSNSTLPICPVTLTGDVNSSGDRVTSDIIYLVNFVLKGGPAPIPCIAAGDVTCGGGVVTSDIIYMVNFVLKGGPAPCDVCTLIPGTWSCP